MNRRNAHDNNTVEAPSFRAGSPSFTGQIRKKYKVGKNRIYAVLDRAGIRYGHESEAP